MLFVLAAPIFKRKVVTYFLRRVDDCLLVGADLVVHYFFPYALSLGLGMG